MGELQRIQTAGSVFMAGLLWNRPTRATEPDQGPRDYYWMGFLPIIYTEISPSRECGGRIWARITEDLLFSRVNSPLSLDWERLTCGRLTTVGGKLVPVSRGRLKPAGAPTSRSWPAAWLPCCVSLSRSWTLAKSHCKWQPGRPPRINKKGLTNTWDRVAKGKALTLPHRPQWTHKSPWEKWLCPVDQHPGSMRRLEASECTFLQQRQQSSPRERILGPGRCLEGASF